MTNATDLNQPMPVMLSVLHRPVLVVGGGKVASRRAIKLLKAGAQVTVIAPDITDCLVATAPTNPAAPDAENFPDKLPLILHRRPFETSDLASSPWFGLVIATNDAALNQTIDDHARTLQAETGCPAWIARADAPEQTDVHFLATGHAGPITLAIHTGGASANAATQIRDELLAALNPHWPVLLEAAAEWRTRIQQAEPDPIKRQPLLKALVDDQAMAVLAEGGLPALQAHHQSRLPPAPGSGPGPRK